MISSLLVEAALRSVLLALVVWAGLRILGVRNVLAQKAAWGLVLAGALAMPLVLPMASHVPAVFVIPTEVLRTLAAREQATPVAAHSSATEPARLTGAENQPATETPLVQIKTTQPRAERERAIRYTVEESSFVAASRYPAPVISDARMGADSAARIPQRLEIDKRLVLQIAGFLYVSVAGVLLFRLFYGLLLAIRVWQSAEAVRLDAAPLTDGLQLRVSDAVASPVTIGSAVVLPADYGDWCGEKLRVVLAHERSHVRQGDFYLQLLSAVYAAAFWPSPLGWWLKRKLSDLAEAISDRAGLEEAADRTSYAQILLEFAAAPRPTLIGVAMARSGSLSRRIERLLNDVSFRQAFAGTRRALVAVMVVPVALFASTALVRVKAAGQQAPAAAPAPAVAPIAPIAGVTAPAAVAPVAPTSGGVSTPEEISDEATPATPAVAPAPRTQAGTPTAAAPAAPASPSVPTIAPAAPTAPASVLTVVPLSPVRQELMMMAIKNRALAKNSLILVAPVAPTMAVIAPRAGYGAGYGYGYGTGQSTATESGSSSYSDNGKHSGYHYSYSSNGESYAVIRGDDMNHTFFKGNWIEGRHEEIEKARKQAHGDFLWFTRDGKSYFVDDAGVVAQIEAMYKPMEDLGKQQEELGRQQEVLGRQQEELGRQQEAVSVPTPDMSKELGQLNEAMAKLKASEGKNMTQEQFAELQERLGELQGKLGEIQGQIGAKQGEFGAKMGKLGAMQGELGAKQGRLGAEQGRLAQEADKKVKSIIDESLKNGKAHPVP